jgi:predicted HTH transcriptional regulator
LKQPWEWDEGNIRDLIASQAQESLTLEYKACAALDRTEAKKREVSKDVSAFANSAGGTIIYGVVEDKHVAMRTDVGYLPTDVTKEWVEHV